MADLVWRPITHDELDAAADLDSRAFRIDTTRVRTGLEGNSRFSWRDVYGVEQNGALAAVLTAFPMDFWLGGGTLAAVAIAGVSVPPEHRRRGLARFMLRETHAHFRAAGRQIAILYPFAVGFYRGLGYEMVEVRHDYRVPAASLPLHPERLSVRLGGPADWSSVHSVYEAHLRQRGGVQRTEAVWRERFHDRDAELVVYQDATGITGYVHYEFKRVESHTPDEPVWFELLVREMVALSGAAERGLLGFLAAQQEQANAIHIVCAADSPLLFALSDPRSFPDRRIEFVMNAVFQGTPGLMLRLLDVPGALAARHYPADVQGEVVLRVADPEQPQAGPWRVRFEGGRADVTPAAGEGGTGDVTVDIATLSALFAGALKAAQAERLGRLQGAPSALATLDAAFATLPLMVQRTDWF